MPKQIKVMVVDDSAFMRKVLSAILQKDPDIVVVGTARDGQDALTKVEKLAPDVITLDVEMPRLDGLSTLRELMRTHPLPVVMLSSLTQQGSRQTLEALSLGAVDFVSKPSGFISLDIEKVEDEIVRKVKTAAGAKVSAVGRAHSHWQVRSQPGNTDVGHDLGGGQDMRSCADGRALALTDLAQRPVATPPGPAIDAKTLVVIGSSTGGPKALESVMSGIPPQLPAAILVVQHMPSGFTKSLAERLDHVCALSVKEAQDGDGLYVGRVLIAPGGYHLVLDESRKVRLNQDPPVNYVRPSVDVTMRSVVPHFGSNLVGVILTGMGRDGADGMALIKRAGGITVMQDRETSTIYSMPRAVAENGDADYILPVNQIGDAIGKLVQRLSH